MIDETLASYRRQGWLVDLTRFGKLVVQLNIVRNIEVDAHQVDVSRLWPISFELGTWESLGGFSECLVKGEESAHQGVSPHPEPDPARSFGGPLPRELIRLVKAHIEAGE